MSYVQPLVRAERSLVWRVSVVDALLVAALTVGVQVEVWTSNVDGPRALVALLGLLITVPLAWRRRWPLATTALVVGAWAALYLPGGAGQPPQSPFVAVFVAAYSVAAYGRRRPALIGGAVIVAGSLVSVVRTPGQDLGDLLFLLVVFGGAWLAGLLFQGREQRAVLLRNKAARLELERDAKAREAVAEERVRIARELHDVVAHSISLMAVEAGAARRSLRPDQRETHELLLSVETTGRQALAEMRRMLGILRKSEEEEALAPQPGISRVVELIAEVRESGLPVELSVEGDPSELPAGLSLSAYRVVQEALTNTLKHARATRASVRIQYQEGDLGIEISDDGSGPVDDGLPGHGILGMRERAALYGGTLEAGGDRTGYHVIARFPLDGGAR